MSKPKRKLGRLWLPLPKRKEDHIWFTPWQRAAGIPQSATTAEDAASVFQMAATSFLEEISEEEKIHFKAVMNLSDMIKDLVEHCSKSKESSKLLRAAEKIESFSRRFQPFFEIVNIFVNSQPEWSSLAWGAIRMVFMLSSNYTSFFQKLAEMLWQMTQMLPSYHDHLRRLRERCPDVMKGRLGKAMSYVYLDILQFCKEALRMFRKQDGRKRNKFSVAFDLFWVPFDVRFEELLKRLRQHQQLFDIELRVENEKALDSFINTVEKDIAEREEMRNDPDRRGGFERDRYERDRARLRDMKKWINSSNFATAFEKARDSRSPGSCTWILQDTVYQSWKIRVDLKEDPILISSNNTLDETHEQSMNQIWDASKVLLLEAKPGFGKTVLSASIIEDLAATRMVSNDGYGSISKNGQHETVYFHFDAQRPENRMYSDALRAIVVQLIHFHQEDLEIIDTISLMMDKKGSGQPVATNGELVDIFLLFVSRLPLLTLILDGIDECQDFVEFLAILDEATTKGNTFKCLLLGRPSIHIPRKYRNLAVRHALHESNNDDIRDYFLLKITELQELGDLDDRVDPSDITNELTLRSNSMFLWATLMMSYLECPALSPLQRLGEIETSNRLEALDVLYSNILQQFNNRFYIEREVLKKIFQLLATSERPITLEELKVAIAIQPGKKLSDSDFIANFPDALRRLCGAVVDIREDGTVQLIHLSMREFLLSEEAKNLETPFYVDLREASMSISAMCLSYLVHDVPSKPLGGSPETLAEVSFLSKQYPFLRFASQFWIIYAVTAVQAGSGTLAGLIADSQPLLKHLTVFLSHKASVSLWIEVCWTYGIHASIENLKASLESRLDGSERHKQSDPIDAQIWASVKRIQSFSDDLHTLEEEWGQLLSLRPFEIWGSSISAFMGSRSWAYNDEVTITRIGTRNQNEDMSQPIWLVSKLSQSGSHIGIVKICQPLDAVQQSSSMKCARSEEEHKCNSDKRFGKLQDVFAIYQILEVETGAPVIGDLHIELDAAVLQKVEEFSKDNEVRIPIAFSPDLAQISILNTVYWLTQDESISEQKIDLFPILPISEIHEPESKLSDAARKVRMLLNVMEKERMVNLEQKPEVQKVNFPLLPRLDWKDFDLKEIRRRGVNPKKPWEEKFDTALNADPDQDLIMKREVDTEVNKDIDAEMIVDSDPTVLNQTFPDKKARFTDNFEPDLEEEANIEMEIDIEMESDIEMEEDIDIVAKNSTGSPESVIHSPTSFRQFPDYITQTLNPFDQSLDPMSQSLDPVTEPSETFTFFKDAPYTPYYRLEFSQCGRYLAVAKRQIDSNRFSKGYWSISIWSRKAARIHSQDSFLWQFSAEISDLYGDFLSEGSFAFNPRYKILAFMLLGGNGRLVNTCQTRLWKFDLSENGADATDENTKMVYGDNLTKLHFSSCGRFLVGDHSVFETLRIVDISKHLTDATPIPPTETLDNFFGANDEQSITSTNSLTIHTPNGIPEFATIRGYSDGAMVQKRLNAMREIDEALLYVPHGAKADMNLTVLENPRSQTGNVRMILTKSSQGSFNLNNPRNLELPVLITRPKRSIKEYKVPRVAQHQIKYTPGELTGASKYGSLKLLPSVQPGQSDDWKEMIEEDISLHK